MLLTRRALCSPCTFSGVELASFAVAKEVMALLGNLKDSSAAETWAVSHAERSVIGTSSVLGATGMLREERPSDSPVVIRTWPTLTAR